LKCSDTFASKNNGTGIKLTKTQKKKKILTGAHFLVCFFPPFFDLHTKSRAKAILLFFNATHFIQTLSLFPLFLMSRQNPVRKKRNKGKGGGEGKRTDRKHPPDSDVTFFFRAEETTHRPTTQEPTNKFQTFSNFFF
jgi:hypothetical protein